MRFTLGDIIHVPKYQFPDKTIKETGKFILVLHITKSKSILVSLTTTQNAQMFEGSCGGCVKSDIVDDLVFGYHFKVKKVICNNGFYFKKETYIISSAQIIEHKFSEIEKHIPPVERMGVLKREIFIEVLECILESGNVKPRSFEKVLGEQLKKLKK